MNKKQKQLAKGRKGRTLVLSEITKKGKEKTQKTKQFLKKFDNNIDEARAYINAVIKLLDVEGQMI